MENDLLTDVARRPEWGRPWLSERPFTGDDLKQIHDASVAVLSQTGFRFASEKVIRLLKDRGFRTQGQIAFFTEKDIVDALEKVPKAFTILARNPTNNIPMERGRFSFGLGRGAVNMVGSDGSSHMGTKQDVVQSTKLSHSLDVLEHWNPLVYPVDLEPANLRLWLIQTAIKYTDKPYLVIDQEDIDLIALAHGTTREEMANREDFSESYGQSTGTVTSPLSMTEENCSNLVEYSRCGIAFHLASMPVAATTGPCTLAGTIIQQNCENLAPLVLAQQVRPGCPVFYGAVGGRSDMRSLRPRFGSPEGRLIERGGAQMALFYGLRCRGGFGLTDAPTLDFQAGAQAMLSAVSTLQYGPEFLPACGLLGSYVGASLAKIILDVELIKEVKHYLAPIRSDRASQAVDVINEVGPGGCFIEHLHTIENFRTEYLTESLFTSTPHEEWVSSGGRGAAHEAFDEAHRIIDAYERPPIDEGLEDEIDSFVKARWVHS